MGQQLMFEGSVDAVIRYAEIDFVRVRDVSLFFGFFGWRRSFFFQARLAAAGPHEIAFLFLSLFFA